MTNKEILKLRFYSDDLGKEITIKKYLKLLLIKLLQETECFDGKRPFGSSGWTYDLGECLRENGIIPTIKDSDDCNGYLTSDFNKKIIEIIKNM